MILTIESYTKYAITVSDFVPIETFELWTDFFGLFVVDANDVVFSTRGEGTSVRFVVDAHYVVVLLVQMEDLFAVLPDVLI